MTMHNYLSPPQPWPPRKKPRVWPWVLGGLSIPVLLFAGCTAVVASIGSSIDTSTPTTIAPAVPIIATYEPVTTTVPVPTGPASSINRDGTYMVGTDIQPGTWRTNGGSGCYWERKANLTGGIGSILDNHLGNGQQLVTILPSDKAFETKRCGGWVLVPE